jgi:hypothetical protein
MARERGVDGVVPLRRHLRHAVKARPLRQPIKRTRRVSMSTDRSMSAIVS